MITRIEDGKLHNEANKSISSLVEEFAKDNGLSFETYLNVLPKKNCPYSNAVFIFMTPMQSSLEAIYHGDNIDNLKNEISLGMCIRTGKGPKDAGISNRHLKSFTMLEISGRMDVSSFLGIQYDLLTLLINEKGNNIQILPRVHQDDADSIRYFTERGIPIEIDHNTDDLLFKREDTDRTGFRVEFNAVIGNKFKWEVLNGVILNKKGNNFLSIPIVDAGGSLERIIALRELNNVQEADVFRSSFFPQYQSFLKKFPDFIGQSKSRLYEHLLDLGYAIILMWKNGIFPAKGNRIKGNANRIMKNFIREFVVSLLKETIFPERIIRFLNDHIKKNHPLNFGLTEEEINQLIELIREEEKSIYSRLIKEKSTESIVIKLPPKNERNQNISNILIYYGSGNFPLIPEDNISRGMPISAALIREKTGKSILLLIRSEEKGGNLMPDLPGGTVEEDEDFVDALKREIREETGLTEEDYVIEGPLASFDIVFGNGQPRREVIYNVVVLKPENKHKIQLREEEHKRYIWKKLASISSGEEFKLNNLGEETVLFFKLIAE